MRPYRNLLVFAALNGAMSVAVGAFGAHGAAPQQAEWLMTGGQYQMVHAALGVAIALWPDAGRSGRAAGWLAVTGGLVFSTTLTLLAITGVRVMGAITPIGGMMMIIGWLVLAFRAFQSPAYLSENRKQL